jgi:TPR repeat protein
MTVFDEVSALEERTAETRRKIEAHQRRHAELTAKAPEVRLLAQRAKRAHRLTLGVAAVLAGIVVAFVIPEVLRSSAHAYRVKCRDGDPEACNRLGRLLHKAGSPEAPEILRKACDADQDEACSWLDDKQSTCRLGSRRDCFELSLTLEESDPVRARALRETACEQGWKEACR